MTQIKGQTLDILLVFSSVENSYHRNFVDTLHGGNPLHHTVGFYFFYHYNLQGSCLRTVIQHWQRLQVSSYRGFFLFNHEPYQPQRINRVGVSFQTTPMGTITYTHGPRTGIDSSRHTHGSESSPVVPRTGTRSKCLQNPWGVTLTMEPNHNRRLQDAVGFFLFTTTNKQIPKGTTYTGLIFSRP